MNLDRTTTTRLVAPRPFYRSQVTPDRFESTSQHRQQYIQANPQRRYSIQHINDDDDDDNASPSSSLSDESLELEFPPPPRDFLSSPVRDHPSSHRTESGSSLSNSYLSDHESSSPTTVTMQPHFHPQYRTTTNPNNRALISVSSGQSPTITIAGSPSRSEIRVSSSPQASKSALREIRISRPDSPSISINRAALNQPITFTNGGGTITNANGNAFHISLGAPSNPSQRGQSPSISRFQPMVTYANSSNKDRPAPAIVTLPPAPTNSTSVTMRHGNVMKRESSEVDHLTKLLLKSMNTTNEPNFFGMCARCNDEIVGEENGLVAMDRMYHVSCFTCTMCGCRLRGMHFYSMENKPYCEPCYINSLEKCVLCARPITDRILRATGKPYHAQCFCCVACQKSLDGISFTVDAHMQIHCIDCFHQKFAPRCYACHRTILPSLGQEETTRIVALDRSYHLECYRCENCQVQFTNEEGCYPVDEHLLCLACNRLYSRTVLGHT